MRYDRKQMKQSAREAVKTTAPKAIFVTLVFWLLTTALVEVIQLLVPNPFSDILSLMTAYPELVEQNPQLMLNLLGNVGGTAVITIFVSIVLSLYSMVMGYSYKGYAVKVYRREETGYGELFSAFPKAGTVIGSVVLTTIYTVLWVMLGVLGFAAVVSVAALVLSETLIAVILYLVAYAGLILLMFWAIYRYAMVPYYVMDQDMGTFEAIRASRDIMKGNKGKLFVLEISFIGWQLLMTLIAGVIVVAGFAVSGGLSDVWGWGIISSAGNPSALLGSGVALSVAGAVALVATLPLKLWLTAYQTTAEAGFYTCLMEYNGKTNSAGEEWRAAEDGAGYRWDPVEPEEPKAETPVLEAKPEEPKANEATPEETKTEDEDDLN